MTTELSAAREAFITYLSSRKRARATVIAYGKDIEQLLMFLSATDKATVTEVTNAEIGAFIKKLESDSYTPKSISRKINSIKTFFRFLKGTGAVNFDPANDIEHPKFEIKPPRVLSKLEYRALRDACRGDLRMYAIVELFLQTGIRIGELAALLLSDVNGMTLHIAEQEGHEERNVPLNKAGQEALSKYIAYRGVEAKSQALFITKTGRPLLIRNIRTAIDRYFRIAGIENAKVNDLRHTFIAHHLMAGTPITTISKLVGHKRLSTTEKYLELVKGQKMEGMKLEEL
jgi:site-specific recombinase XerD